MYVKNIALVLLSLLCIGLGIVLLLTYIKHWNCSKSHDSHHGKCNMKPKGCCVGCSSCEKYTQKAKEIMDQQQESTDAKTYTGILVDMRCYSQDNRNWTDKHFTPEGKEMPGCGKVCASRGIPVGLLVTPRNVKGHDKPCKYGDGCSGDVYVLYTESPKLSPYVGKVARVTGRYMTKSHGLFTIKIEIQNGKKWDPVEVRTMM